MQTTKTLIVVRHAKSSWKYPALSDLERPLNKRGKRDAPVMAKIMCQKNIRIDAILSSPAQRTLSTAYAFAEAIEFPLNQIIINAAIYEVTAKDLLLTIQQNFNDEWQNVLVFGHNYCCTELANWYAEDPIDNIPTCGFVAIDFNQTKWASINKINGRIRFYEYPKKQLD